MRSSVVVVKKIKDTNYKLGINVINSKYIMARSKKFLPLRQNFSILCSHFFFYNIILPLYPF